MVLEMVIDPLSPLRRPLNLHFSGRPTMPNKDLAFTLHPLLVPSTRIMTTRKVR